MESESKLSELQKNFLQYLAGEAKGDVKAAMRLAGYSDKTNSHSLVKSLRKEIIEIAEQLLAAASIKSVLAMIDSVDNPSKPATNNKINAAKELLDRAGLGKKDSGGTVIKTDSIFIMPPKTPIVVD